MYGNHIFIAFLLLIIERKYHLTDNKFTNFSNDSIKAKDEDTDKIIYVEPNQTKSVDEININGQVYKFCTGTHVIYENSKIKTLSLLSGKIVNSIIGGKIKYPPDKNWNKLFEI